MPEHDAVVVGAGPNGLAAAVTLARRGADVLVLEANDTIGGGARTAELTEPGFLHDLGSAIHPMGVASPFFRTLPLARYGLEWIHPEIPLAHPLHQGHAALHYRSLEATAAALGADGAAYRRLFEPFVAQWEALMTETLRPLLHIPKHPGLLAAFGLKGIQPATLLARRTFKTAAAQALFAGHAAHSNLALEAPISSSFGLILGSLAHAVGWPLPKGGAQAIADALAGYLRALGGRIETGVRVQSLAELPPSKAVLLDVSPRQFLQMAGGILPGGYRRQLERFRYGMGVFKIDYALHEPIPWTHPGCRKAGTVHVCGTLEEVAASEWAAAQGRPPERPFLLVSQPSLFDDTRAPAGNHTAWVYCHVPNGSGVDMTARIEDQLERFAPGFRETVRARCVSAPYHLEQQNANLIGGSVSGGANDLWHLLARPVLHPVPYRTPLRGVYLCSASTPPGGGVHGMCGHLAAQVVLRDGLA